MSKELAEKLDSAAGAPPAARERFERARSMLVVADVDWEKRLETSQIRSEDGILNFSTSQMARVLSMRARRPR